MAEWSIAPVLKTGDPQGSVGSNPTPSAMLIMNDLDRDVHPHRNTSRNTSILPLSFLLGLFYEIGRAVSVGAWSLHLHWLCPKPLRLCIIYSDMTTKAQFRSDRVLARLR